MKPTGGPGPVSNSNTAERPGIQQSEIHGFL
jgi:hypothetical protein